jgi:phosphohistidine phosphatase
MAERRVYLVRHAIAEDRAASGRDADRALTREGRKKMKRAASGLAALGIRAPMVFTSPLVRARETAAILAEALPGARVEVCDLLAPGVDAAALAAFLDRRSESAPAMLVGHEPDLSEVLSEWLTGSPARLATRFRKGAVACVLAGTLPPQGRATLEWLMTADQLGEAGGG